MKIKKYVAFFLVSTIALLFCINFTNAQTCPDTTNWDNSTGVCIPTNTGLPDAGGGENPVEDVIINVMNWLLGIVGMAGIIAFVVAGILYMISAGEEDKMKTAKNAMTWSIIGIIVALSGYIIIQAVEAMLSGTDSMF